MPRFAVAIASVTAVAAVSAAAFVFWPRPVGWGNAPFDSERWIAAKNSSPDNPRGKMIRSLVRSHELRGKTRAEIVALLGAPDGADRQIADSLRVSDDVASSASEFDYVLGMYSGYRVDYDFLSVEFDREGRVRAWWVWQG